MAYSNSASERMDELRFRSQQSPRNDSALLGLVSPPRNGTRMPQPLQNQDGRGGLMRRFTTDSGRVPTIASIAGQRGGQEAQDYGPSVSYCPSTTIVPKYSTLLLSPTRMKIFCKITLLTFSFFRHTTRFNL
jgi:hypothetical protein